MFLVEVFGQQVKNLMSKRYGLYFLLVPFPRDPLRFRIFIPKTRIVPRCISLLLSQLNHRLVVFAVRKQGMKHVFVMIMFLYVCLDSCGLC